MISKEDQLQSQIKSINKILNTEEQTGVYIMPFGQHKGRDVCELDDNYLLFLHEKCELHGSLKLVVRKEVKERKL